MVKWLQYGALALVMQGVSPTAQAQDDQKDYKDKNAPRHRSLLFKRLKPELALDALTPNVRGHRRAAAMRKRGTPLHARPSGPRG